MTVTELIDKLIAARTLTAPDALVHIFDSRRIEDRWQDPEYEFQLGKHDQAPLITIQLK